MAGDWNEKVKTHGQIALATYPMLPEYTGLSDREVWERLQDAQPQNSAVSDNIICVAGLNVLLPALMWAAIEDQNDNMGSPFARSLCAPVFGAVGDGGTEVIALASDGQPLPQATIYVSDTSAMATSGTIYLWDSPSQTYVPITYTGTTGGGSPSLTGCAGGAGYTLHYSAYFFYTPPTADSDVALSEEFGRTSVMSAAITNGFAGADGYISWSFLLPVASVTSPITETGVFFQASGVPGAGQLFDHSAINSLWGQDQLLTMVATFSFGNS